MGEKLYGAGDQVVAALSPHSVWQGDGRGKPSRNKKSKEFQLTILSLMGLRVLIVVFVLVVWWATARGHVVPAGLASSPRATWSFIWTSFQERSFWENFWASLEATLISFVLGSVLGIMIGMGLSLSPFTQRLFSPFLMALNSMPRIALAPLFLIYFGITIYAKIALAVSLVVFILLENTIAGVKSVDPDITRLYQALGVNRRQLFVKVMLPTATPAIFAGLRLGMIYAFLGVVTSEILSAKLGLGQLVAYYSNTFNMAGVYGVLIVLAIVAASLNFGMTRLERRLLRWQSPSSGVHSALV